MRVEVDETAAEGEIAHVYAEVRRLWGVSYVSAIHRQMAASPGLLEWAWESVAPVFRDGIAQRAGWVAAERLEIEPLAQISHEAMAMMGVRAADLAAVCNVVAGFVRVAPVNLVFGGLVKALLEGFVPSGTATVRQAWTPPAPLPSPPSMLAPEALPPDQRAVLLRFATPTAGGPFVPGLYRMLAHWPALLAHLADTVPPRLQWAQTQAAFDQLRNSIDARVSDVLAELPALRHDRAKPDATHRAQFLSAAGVYRQTSPELVVVGRLLLAALPLPNSIDEGVAI